MAAFLSAGNKTIIDAVVKLSDASPIDKPFDSRLVERLAKAHTALGYTSEIAFQEAMRDRPTNTLLKAIQYLNAHA